MIKEAIILAGGLGTRLKEAVPDLPKCMAPVAGHPFLFYVVQYLLDQGIERFVFSLGYKHEAVEAFLKAEYPTLNYQCVVEKQPLQTGGAIKLALQATKDDHILVMNGDTMFCADITALYKFHQSTDAECTLALKPMQQFDRYGAVLLNDEGRILSFEEKQFLEAGNINGGVYLIHRGAFLADPWPEIFSFEREYLTRFCQQKRFFGLVEDAYFIDIGIPSDFSRAQRELKRFTFPFDQIDKSWTLFLDRDGVINVNKDDSYVFNRKEFIFKEGALEAMAELSTRFQKIIVVTNQRGIGRGLMTVEDLEDIHDYMKQSVASAGGRIDDIFYCPFDDNHHPDRKPNPGMGLTAQKKYPEIDFARSIIIGDKSSDMKWGRNLKTKTVLISSDRYHGTIEDKDVDLFCSGLMEFVQILK